MRSAKIIILISLFSCSIFSYASEQIINIRTIGIAPNGIHKHGQSSGIYYDLANLIVANAGYRSSNKIAPYARIVKSLKFGSTDLTIMFRYAELDDYVDYIAPLPSKHLVVIGLQGKHFENISSLSGKKLIYLRGAKFSQQIDNDNSINKHFVSDFLLAVKVLVAGRGDAIIGPIQSIQRATLEFEALENKKVHFGEPLIIDTRTPWIQTSKKSAPYLDRERLKQSFLQLEKSNTFETIKAKYTTY